MGLYRCHRQPQGHGSRRCLAKFLVVVIREVVASTDTDLARQSLVFG